MGVNEIAPRTIWVTSDTHFSHARILTFQDPWGEIMRPFSSVEEMDETLVARWNDRVRPHDHVYHLGDVAMTRPALQIVKRLNGKKRLIFGNHDIYDYKSYTEVGFEKLMGYRVFEDLFLSHVPIHPSSMPNFINVHGHIHGNGDLGEGYINMSVEATNFAPLSLEEIRDRVKKNQWIVCQPFPRNEK